MADTTNFGWTKPSVGAAGWGVTLNTLVDAIDTDLFVAHDADGTLKAGAVDGAAVLASNVVTEAKILDNAVTTNKIADDAVTAAKIADDAVTSAHISGGYIFVVCDKDSDGTFQPLSSASWQGASKTNASDSIDWNTDFDVPTTAKAVIVNLMIAGGANSVLSLAATSDSILQWQLKIPPSGSTAYGQMTVAVTSEGTSWYSTVSDYALSVYITVVGYFI